MFYRSRIWKGNMKILVLFLNDKRNTIPIPRSEYISDERSKTFISTSFYLFLLNFDIWRIKLLEGWRKQLGPTPIPRSQYKSVYVIIYVGYVNLRIILLTTLSINIPHFPFCTTLLKLQNFHLLIELTNHCPGSGPYLLTSSVLRFSPKLCITEFSSEEEINLNNKIHIIRIWYIW